LSEVERKTTRRDQISAVGLVGLEAMHGEAVLVGVLEKTRRLDSLTRRAHVGVYTDWFLADESEAEALARSESPFDDWPCLSMKSIIETELMILWGLLRGEPDSLDDVTDDVLFMDSEDDGPFVFRVTPAFIAALAALDKPGIERVAREWHGCEQMAEWELPDLAEMLREMVEFAQRARRESKPVLQLA
jgi:hypothetical protein